MKALLALLLLIAFAIPGSARPPFGSDPTSPTAQWFARQHNQRGGSCCGEADGHRLDDNQWRIAGTGAATHYEVFFDDEWHVVDDWMLRQDANDPNPTGKAVVWYGPGGGYSKIQIFCFTPGWVS